MSKLKIILIVVSISLNIKAQTANEIIRKAEDTIKGNTAHGEIEMAVETSDFTRTLVMESWWVGNDKALIVVKTPKREAGNKTLKIKNEMWNYLKNTETTIKIPPSMMLQSWNGSDFTNDDLVRESNLDNDYYQKIIGEETIDGVQCWKIELDPKPDAPVVWGKLYYWVRMNDYLPARIDYYDEKGGLMRYMIFTDIKTFSGRKLPSVWSMHNKVKKGNSTKFKIISMEFDIRISDRTFSFQELERGN
ncbi:MAG: outer membrane lipoprotein-sorting protein [Ignavibacteria bacterium RBG_13_36_8]|nr:MAG: outer membrane lipoprotein-sorting protein [Ignavibacteria bacterium RBG_13_36_8]